MGSAVSKCQLGFLSCGSPRLVSFSQSAVLIHEVFNFGTNTSSWNWLRSFQVNVLTVGVAQSKLLTLCMSPFLGIPQEWKHLWIATSLKTTTLRPEGSCATSNCEPMSLTCSMMKQPPELRKTRYGIPSQQEVKILISNMFLLIWNLIFFPWGNINMVSNNSHLQLLPWSAS